MPDNVDKIRNIDESKFHGKHNFLAEGLMMPMMNHVNGNRSQMFSSHVVQAIQLRGSEIPLIGTGFENQVLKHSALGYKTLSDGKWMVLKKIIKNKYNYDLIVQNEDTREYDIIHRHEAINLTEKFGIHYHNEKIDSHTEGDEISDKEVLYHDNNYDDDMQASYGTNLNVAYVSFSGYTNEDAIAVSESAAKKLGSTFVQKVKVNFNTNDIPLNIFGNNDEYKAFPNIGEFLPENHPLLSIRRINYQNFAYEMKNNNLQKELAGDKNFYAKGKVIDIDIYSNEDIDKLSQEAYNGQIYENYLNNRKFYKEFIDYTMPIVTGKKNKFSTELRATYNKYAHLLDQENIKFSSDGHIFDKLVIEFTIYYEDTVTPGMKISNRYGKDNLIFH